MWTRPAASAGRGPVTERERRQPPRGRRAGGPADPWPGRPAADSSASESSAWSLAMRARHRLRFVATPRRHALELDHATRRRISHEVPIALERPTNSATRPTSILTRLGSTSSRVMIERSDSRSSAISRSRSASTGSNSVPALASRHRRITATPAWAPPKWSRSVDVAGQRPPPVPTSYRRADRVSSVAPLTLAPVMCASQRLSRRYRQPRHVNRAVPSSTTEG